MCINVIVSIKVRFYATNVLISIILISCSSYDFPQENSENKSTKMNKYYDEWVKTYDEIFEKGFSDGTGFLALDLNEYILVINENSEQAIFKQISNGERNDKLLSYGLYLKIQKSGNITRNEIETIRKKLTIEEAFNLIKKNGR